MMLAAIEMTVADSSQRTDHVGIHVLPFFHRHSDAKN